jgi:hypothetical protein
VHSSSLHVHTFIRSHSAFPPSLASHSFPVILLADTTIAVYSLSPPTAVVRAILTVHSVTCELINNSSASPSQRVHWTLRGYFWVRCCRALSRLRLVSIADDCSTVPTGGAFATNDELLDYIPFSSNTNPSFFGAYTQISHARGYVC